ncbi:MAG: DUF4911 domain-containing protein [Thermodesulfobacteriota bacterium]
MMTAAETSRQYYRVAGRDISFFRFILEGYDGLAVLTTLDAQSGQVVLTVAPGCERDVAGIISGLKDEIMIEPVPAPGKDSDLTDDDALLLY